MAQLATYASDARASLGRFYDDTPCPTRSVFQRDRDRILHSTAFRRLKHKTQVFINVVGDHYRTRLTHTLEVAQIARTMALVLGLDEYLTETIALAHDIGHPPFGHVGERALNKALGNHGVFDHNAHTIKILTQLEERYARYDGLNLCWETLEGIIKHNGPLMGKSNTHHPRVHPDLLALNHQWDFRLDSFASLEAQIAAIADDVAYVSHDLEDGLRAELFCPNDCMTLPMLGPLLQSMQEQFPHVSPKRQMYEANSAFTRLLVQDVVKTTRDNIQKHHIQNPEDVRLASITLAMPSTEAMETINHIKVFLSERMYKHQSVARSAYQASRVISTLFSTYFHHPECLPNQLKADMKDPDPKVLAGKVADFIAGMTDRFALAEYKALA